jgi:vacuolar-type H+-ATPase subunit H
MIAYIKRTERSQINNLMLHLKRLEKQDQAKPITSRRREITKIRDEINERGQKTLHRINKTKN